MQYRLAEASIIIYLGRGNFILIRRGTKVGPKPEAQRAESGGEVIGKGQRAPSPPARGLG